MANLDPDFRKDPKDASKPFCCRCQKNFKDGQKHIAVTVDWNTWNVTLGGQELLGSDCARKIGLNA